MSWGLWLKNRNDWTLNTTTGGVALKMVSPINTRTFAMDAMLQHLGDTAGNQLPTSIE